MIRQLFAVGAALGICALGTPAFAANCADRDMVVDRLQTHYNEEPAAAGLQTVSDKQSLVEVWASEETGTFTVMLTMPNGMTCIVATGTDWHQSAPGSRAPGSAS